MTSIETDGDPSLGPVRETLDAQWGELFEAAYGEETPTSPRIRGLRARQSLHRHNLRYLTEHLLGRSPRSTLLLGGGYEFPRLHEIVRDGLVVADLSPAALERFRRETRLPDDAYTCRRWDASGMPAAHQEALLATEGRETDTLADWIRRFESFFDEMPRLDPWPFDDDAFELIVSPVLVESLPFGTPSAILASRMELVRAERPDADLTILSSCFGEAFYYRPSVRRAFVRLLNHHLAEARRCLAPGGVLYFSVWLRPDELAGEHGHDGQNLWRVGDVRVAESEWQRALAPWASFTSGRARVYGLERPSTFQHMLLAAIDRP